MAECFLLLWMLIRSKWTEVIEMKSTTAAATITQLRQLFATYGLPEQVVTNDGPQFSAGEFSSFLKSNGVKHIQCVPYHPSSNGGSRMFHTNIQKSHQSRRNTRSYIPSKVYELSSGVLVYTTFNNRCSTMCFIS